MLAIRFYDAVVAVHIMAVVIAFGVVFTYPVLVPWLRRTHPGSMAVVHETQGRIGRYVVIPAATAALLTGMYLASDANLWGEVWVIVPFLILVGILGVTGAVLAPLQRDLVGLASAGVDAPAYGVALKRHVTVSTVVAVLVLVAIFLMTTKLGA